MNSLKNLDAKIQESEEKIEKLVETKTNEKTFNIQYLEKKIEKMEASKKESDKIIVNLVTKVRSLSESLIGLKMQKMHQNQNQNLNAQNMIMKHTVRKD